MTSVTVFPPENIYSSSMKNKGTDFFQADTAHAEIFQKSRQLSEVLKNLTFEGKLKHGKNLKRLHTVIQFFEKRALDRFETEERIVFPFMRTHVPRFDVLLNLLGAEHREFFDKFNSLKKTASMLKAAETYQVADLVSRLRADGAHLLHLLRNILLEGKIVYRAVMEITPAEKKTLADRIRACKKGGQRHGRSKIDKVLG